MDSNLLVTNETSLKFQIVDFIIWHGHLWGGRFQMSVMREHQVAGGNGRDPQIEILAIRNRINPVSDEILAPFKSIRAFYFEQTQVI